MKLPDMQVGLVKALLYGPPGTTKTRTGASAVFVPEMSPVLMLESAGNPLSIRDYNPLPTILTMENLKDYNLPYDYLVTGQQENHPFRKMCIDAGVDFPDEPFKTVFVDGMTEVQRFAFRAFLSGVDVSVGDVPTAIELQHFNRMLAIMVNWAYKFIRLDMHVILSSLEAEKQDKSGSMWRRPLLWGQSQGEIASYVYMVMRLTHTENMDTRTKSVVANELEEVRKSQTVGFLKSSSSFYAKEQYGINQPYILDPTMRKIWDAIQGI